MITDHEGERNLTDKILRWEIQGIADAISGNQRYSQVNGNSLEQGGDFTIRVFKQKRGQFDVESINK